MDPVTFNDALKWHVYQRDRRKLGTAAWRPDSSFGQFSAGDIWLGKTEKGQIAGIRDDRHILLCSGSRGNKGVSFVIPNLAFWPGSAVVIDPKGENAIITARRRGTGSKWARGLGQTVYILDPFNVVQTPVDQFADLKAAFNPLDMLSASDPESVDTAFRIAEAFVPGETNSDPFFDDSGKEFISALMLHVASASHFAAHDRNLLTVRRLIVAGDTDAAELIQKAIGKGPSGYSLLFESMKKNKAFDGVIARAGATYLDLEANSPRLFGSIVQVAKTNTRFIDGESMKRVLSHSSFKPSALKQSAKGETVYLCLPQRAMDTHYRWLRMMVTIIASEMERGPIKPESGHPVLMLLDEFPALRRMRVLENAAAQIAGFGVKLAVIVQNLGQLKELYKDNWETFIANSGIKLFSCNDDHFTRDYVSKLIGEEDVVLYNQSKSATEGESRSSSIGSSYSSSSGSTFGLSSGQSSYSVNSGESYGRNASITTGQSTSVSRGFTTSIQKRPLLAPDEVGRQFGDRANPRTLVLISGQQPAALRQTFYYSEKRLEGSYDWHPNHAAPRTLARIHQIELLAALERARNPPKTWEQLVAETCARHKPEAQDEPKGYWAKKWETYEYDFGEKLATFGFVCLGIAVWLYIKYGDQMMAVALALF